MYRFSVTDDAEGAVDLGRLTMEMSLLGMRRANGNMFSRKDFQIFRVVNQSADLYQEVADISLRNIGTRNSVQVVANFNFQNFAVGEAKTYGLFVSNLERDETGNPAAVSVSFLNDRNYVSPNARGAHGDTYTVLSDKSSPNHSGSSLDWTNGFLQNIVSVPQLNRSSIATSVEMAELGNIAEIVAYPNPAMNVINVAKAPEGSLYRILNISGQVQISGNLHGKIDVSNLLPGMYFLNISNEGGTNIASLKIIKK